MIFLQLQPLFAVLVVFALLFLDISVWILMSSIAERYKRRLETIYKDRDPSKASGECIGRNTSGILPHTPSYIPVYKENRFTDLLVVRFHSFVSMFYHEIVWPRCLRWRYQNVTCRVVRQVDKVAKMIEKHLDPNCAIFKSPKAASPPEADWLNCLSLTNIFQLSWAQTYRTEKEGNGFRKPEKLYDGWWWLASFWVYRLQYHLSHLAVFIACQHLSLLFTIGEMSIQQSAQLMAW